MSYSFLYLLYSNDNTLGKIKLKAADLTNYFRDEWVALDVELICQQVNVTCGEALQSYMKNERDIVNSIMALT